METTLPRYALLGKAEISRTVTEGIDRDTSIGSWMEENVDELVIAKNAFKDFQARHRFN